MDDPKIGRKKKSDKSFQTRAKMGPYSTRWVRIQENCDYAKPPAPPPDGTGKKKGKK
jgi:hypothetical protein